MFHHLTSQSRRNATPLEFVLRNLFLCPVHACPTQIHAKTLAFRTPGAKLVAVSDIFEEAGARVVEGCNGMPKYYKVSRLFSSAPRKSVLTVSAPQ